MTDIGNLLNLNIKWYACYHHGNHGFLNLKFKKIDSLALIIEILYLKQIFFETDSCSSALTTFTSNMQSCFKIDLGLTKLTNAKLLCFKARVFW